MDLKAAAVVVGGLAMEIGNKVKQAAAGGGGWFGPHMSAASRAVFERFPLVDILLEVRDARIPESSKFEMLNDYTDSCKRIIVLNKMDLANQSRLQEWMRYFDEHNYVYHGVNSHNKDSVKKFLNFLQARVRELKKTDYSGDTKTLMLVGIPNVGKSALANSLHQIGRISAAEKGKLRHATVSPHPGETKHITSLKIGSHPNIYVLDTPGILPPEVKDAEVCSKLALAGVIRDTVVGEKDLGRYLLSVINSCDQYKNWATLTRKGSVLKSRRSEAEDHSLSELDKALKKHVMDHTQDFIVQDVRRTLYETIFHFNGELDQQKDFARLVAAQLDALREVLDVSSKVDDDVPNKVAAKLLNLYRTGRLGHYTLDKVPAKF